jgi:alpha-D-xyloside xylohydrolase
VPWLFDDQSSDVVRSFVKLKHRLMPYVFRAAMEARDTGAPVMRPMVFEYPGDPAAAHLDMQYMLGASLLVAPVSPTMARWSTGQVRVGGRWHGGRYDYLSLPLYVRPATLLALGAEDSRPDYDYQEGVELRLYRMEKGQSAVCEIPTTTGEAAARVTASRDARVLTFQLSRQIPHGILALCGISAVSDVKGGTARARGADTVITPRDTTVIVTL